MRRMVLGISQLMKMTMHVADIHSVHIHVGHSLAHIFGPLEGDFDPLDLALLVGPKLVHGPSVL